MSSETAFRIDRTLDGRVALTLLGSVGAEASESLYRAALELVGPQDISVDFREANTIDVSVVQILLALQAAIQPHGATLRVEGASAELGNLLKLAGCDPSWHAGISATGVHV